MPFIVTQIVRCLHANGKRPSTGHILEMYLVSTVYRNFDIIDGSLAMNNYSILDSGLKLEINVTAVPNIKSRQIDTSIPYAECDYILE